MAFLAGAPEGIRTPNLLIRSQMLYPLSYGRLGIACNLGQPTVKLLLYDRTILN
jgi:hypothetical protein